MAHNYENDVEKIMYELIECAYRDRTAMMDSLTSGTPNRDSSDLTGDDLVYYNECAALCRDFIRMDANRKIGVFHKDTVKRLNSDDFA